jgi:hypothetical protein
VALCDGSPGGKQLSIVGFLASFEGSGCHESLWIPPSSNSVGRTIKPPQKFLTNDDA